MCIVCKFEEEKETSMGRKTCNLGSNIGLDIERKDPTVGSSRKAQLKSWELREMVGGEIEDSMGKGWLDLRGTMTIDSRELLSRHHWNLGRWQNRGLLTGFRVHWPPLFR